MNIKKLMPLFLLTALCVGSAKPASSWKEAATNPLVLGAGAVGVASIAALAYAKKMWGRLTEIDKEIEELKIKRKALPKKGEEISEEEAKQRNVLSRNIKKLNEELLGSQRSLLPFSTVGFFGLSMSMGAALQFGHQGEKLYGDELLRVSSKLSGAALWSSVLGPLIYWNFFDYKIKKLKDELSKKTKRLGMMKSSEQERKLATEIDQLEKEIHGNALKLRGFPDLQKRRSFALKYVVPVAAFHYLIVGLLTGAQMGHQINKSKEQTN